ncbi:MAG: hypothetical protein NTY48_07070 [Candidatus Diapherotrites archaeon]|nr:hypothetical protein [Candidatus Diapherotrites archaeon]
MNNKGLLFTVMTLFLIFGILSLNEALSDASRGFEVPKEALVLSSSAKSLENAESMLWDFDKYNYAKDSIKRALPFDFNLEKDQNYLTISIDSSLASSQLSEVFDYLNLGEAFFEDSNVFGGTILDINVPKNAQWGGSSGGIDFLVPNLCYQFSLLSETKQSLSKSDPSQCSNPFSTSSIKKIDINIIVLSSVSDFNSLTCNGALCPTQVFNPSSPNPYYNITIIDSNCPSCSVSPKRAYSHFSAGSDNNFQLKCTWPGCISSPLTFSIKNMDLNFYYFFDKKLRIITRITFNAPPSGFIVKGTQILSSSDSKKAFVKSG